MRQYLKSHCTILLLYHTHRNWYRLKTLARFYFCCQHHNLLSSYPVNILGITAFDSKPNYEDITCCIGTNWKKSQIYWKGSCEPTIYHLASQLPETPLASSTTHNDLCSYIKWCESVMDDAVHFCNSACCAAHG